jgi:L-lactate dehydrogenase complex protein LldG
MVEEARQAMSAARREILNRIHAATAPEPDQRVESYRAIARHYTVVAERDAAGRLDLFRQRLCDYGATVYRCGEHEISTTVAQALKTRQKTGLLVSTDIPTVWLPELFEFRSDAGMTYEQLDQSQGVLTGCALAIALTGTILLQHTEVAGRRALTLIPDYHLCVVFSQQVVETVPEGIRSIQNVADSPLTTISGPSATSDIEMTRVKGVHGPRVLDVILVEDQKSS